MRKKCTAFTLIGLLVILALFSLFFGIYILPQIANEMAMEFPEMINVKIPMLILVELLILLFVSGILIVIYLLKMYIKDNIYNMTFTNLLGILVIMCFLAAISLVAILVWLSSYGGPGPGLAIMLIAAILVLLIISIVIYLIRVVILEASELKAEIELVV